MTEQTLGQRIAAQRKKLGLSQEALGERMGVSRQAISKWESDAAVPEIDKLIAMTRLFGVTLGWLMGLEEESSGQTAAFSDEQLELIRRMIPQPPRPRRTPWIVAIALSAAALLIAVSGRPAGLDYSTQIRDLQYNYQNLQGTLDSMNYRLDAMLEEDVEMLLLDYGIRFGGIQSDGTARVLFNATPREWSPDRTAFLAVLRDGQPVAEVPCEMDGAVFTAAVDLPLADGYMYHFVAVDADGSQKFQPLEDDTCAYLASDTSIVLESWVLPEAEYRRNTLYFNGLDMTFTQPLLTMKFEQSTWTKLDYVVTVNGTEVRRESFLDPDCRDSPEWHLSEFMRSFGDITLNSGDRVSLTVDAAVSSGLSESLTLGTWLYRNGKLVYPD